MSNTPTASEKSKAQAEAAMASEAPPKPVKYTLILPEGKDSISIKGFNGISITKAHIEGPDGPTFVKALKTLDQKDGGKRVATYIKQV